MNLEKLFVPIPYKKITNKQIPIIRRHIINYVDSYLKHILSEFAIAERELKRKLKKK